MTLNCHFGIEYWFKVIDKTKKAQACARALNYIFYKL